MKALSGTYRLSLAANIIFILLLAVGFVVMPPFADDLWYYSDLFAARENGSSEWTAVCDTVTNHYLYDNGRLSNVFFSLSLLLPRWIGSLLAAAALGMALYFAYRLIAKFSQRPIGLFTVVMIITLCGLALPWYDYIYLQCYQFNYLISTGFSMLAIYLALTSEDSCNKTLALLGAFLVGLFAGGWHEGFGVPVFFGILTLLFLRKGYRNSVNLSLAAGMIAGIVWVFTSPGALGRMGETGPVFSRVVTVMMLHPAFLLTVVIFIILAFKRKVHELTNSPFIIILGVSALISLAIHIASVRAPRAGWWCEFDSIILIGYFVNLKEIHHRRILKYTGVLLLAVTFVKLVVSDVYALKYRDDYPSLVSDYRKSADGTVFVDFTPEYASPLIAWMTPSFHIYYDRYQRWMFAECYGNENKIPVVIPLMLKDLDWKEGSAIEGDLEVRQFGDFYLCRAEDFTSKSPKADAGDGEFSGRVKIGPITLESVRIFYFFFENDKGGKYVLLLPWRVFPVSPVFKIKEISFAS